MSYNQQHTGCSDARSASGFSPISTSFQQTGGESERFSTMVLAIPGAPQGYMTYRVNNLGQPTSGYGPSQGFTSYPADPTMGPSGQTPGGSGQPTTQWDMKWSQAPLQQGWNMPAHHYAEQVNPITPTAPALNQSMQFSPRVEQSFPMVPQCSTGYPAFGSRPLNQVYYT